MSSRLENLLAEREVAVQDDPQNPVMHVELAEVLEELARPESAQHHYQIAAALFLSRGHSEEAEATCRRALDIDAGDAVAWDLLQQIEAERRPVHRDRTTAETDAAEGRKGRERSATITVEFPATEAELFGEAFDTSAEAEPEQDRWTEFARSRDEEAAEESPAAPWPNMIDRSGGLSAPDPLPGIGALRSRATARDVAAGEWVVRAGEPGTGLLVVTDGEVESIHRVAGETPVIVERFGPPGFWGELAMLGDGHQPFSLRTSGGCSVLEIGSGPLQQEMRTNTPLERRVRRAFRDRLVESIVRTCPLFSRLAPQAARELVRLFSPTRQASGKAIIREGDDPPGLFVVLLGGVVVTRRGGGADSTVAPEGSQVAFLRHGDFFGEMSLISGEPACATVTARGFAQLLHLAPTALSLATEKDAGLLGVLEESARRRGEANRAAI